MIFFCKISVSSKLLVNIFSNQKVGWSVKEKKEGRKKGGKAGRKEGGRERRKEGSTPNRRHDRGGRHGALIRPKTMPQLQCQWFRTNNGRQAQHHRR